MPGVISGGKRPEYRIAIVTDGVSHVCSTGAAVPDFSTICAFPIRLQALLGPHFIVDDWGEASIYQAVGGYIAQWTEVGFAPYKAHSILWATHVQPNLEATTGERIDLAILAFGRMTAATGEPTLNYLWFLRNLHQFVESLANHGVKKILLLTPYTLNWEDRGPWIPSLANEVYHTRFNYTDTSISDWPVGTKVLDVWSLFDWELDLDFHFDPGGAPWWQKIWLNAAGHQKMAHYLARYIRQLIHKKPMRWPGTVPYRDDVDDQVKYPPNWWIDE